MHACTSVRGCSAYLAASRSGAVSALPVSPCTCMPKCGKSRMMAAMPSSTSAFLVALARSPTNSTDHDCSRALTLASPAPLKCTVRPSMKRDTRCFAATSLANSAPPPPPTPAAALRPPAATSLADSEPPPPPPPPPRPPMKRTSSPSRHW